MNLYFTAYLSQRGRITAPGLSFDRDAERRRKSIFFKSLYRSSHLPKPSASSCQRDLRRSTLERDRVAPPPLRRPASQPNPASPQKPRLNLTQSTQADLHLRLVFRSCRVETFSEREQALLSRPRGPSRSVLDPLLSNS